MEASHARCCGRVRRRSKGRRSPTNPRATSNSCGGCSCGLPADHLAAVTESLEAVYENLIENGSLPAPAKSDASGPAERDSPTRGPRRPA